MVTMLAGYLAAQHHIPVARIVEILADLAGIEVSSGWVTTACARMAASVEPANEAIKDAIAAAPVAHFDETVRHVALCNRVEVKGLHRRAVAAATH
jgi:transposase